MSIEIINIQYPLNAKIQNEWKLIFEEKNRYPPTARMDDDIISKYSMNIILAPQAQNLKFL